MIVQPLAGQDQMFSLRLDALDPTGSHFAPHCDKRERLLADAQVLLVHLPSPVGAHFLHSLQVRWVKEGLCRSVAALTPDELLPLVLVERCWSPRGKVALDEGVEAVVPFGEQAGSVVFSKRLMTKQETDGKSEEGSEGSHFPAFLDLTAVKASVRLTLQMCEPFFCFVSYGSTFHFL